MNKVVSESLVLEAKHISKSYQEGNTKLVVLDQLSLRLKQGERLAIVGSSGAGKSTLLNLLGGLDVADTGDVNIVGQSLFSLNADQRGQMRNQHLGFVYQFHHLLIEFTALENVAMPLLIGGENKKSAFKKAENMLIEVGLGERVHHKPPQLSGGERQRVAIARAVVPKPSCVLLDEPTGNLDVNTADHIHSLLWKLNSDRNISFIIVTHDLKLAEQTDRVLELKQGQLHEVECSA